MPHDENSPKQVSDSDALKAEERKPIGFFGIVGWCLAVLLAFGVGGVFVMAREHRLQNQRTDLQQTAAKGPFVLVAPVTQSPGEREVRIPANIHGYVETWIYAKIAGYMKTIYVDKGDRIHKGQVLAILESPELDQQVRNAKATYELNAITDKRYQELLRTAVVAQQIADNSHFALLQSKAAYEQLVATQAYEVITAPMDGMITARYVDPGALIPQSTTPSSGGIAILAMATLQPVRIYANVPQDAASFVKVGDPATITVTQYPGRDFVGTVTRHPQALSADTLTMLVEVDLANVDSALLPGMYATLDMKIPVSDRIPVIPDDALVFRDGKVYAPLVKDDHIHLAEVVLGDDNGRDVQITRGVAPNDLVVLNVGQGVQDGMAVQPQRSDQPQAANTTPPVHQDHGSDSGHGERTQGAAQGHANQVQRANQQ
ncbi:MAG TPA: efflux RND transporter periplasmic adaptor subunit [Candidatus Binataceae bacterium]|nr:efflux RND transporter periplasmic adaptor subunit [Candidatus Binataceae bacterium]